MRAIPCFCKSTFLVEHFSDPPMASQRPRPQNDDGDRGDALGLGLVHVNELGFLLLPLSVGSDTVVVITYHNRFGGPIPAHLGPATISQAATKEPVNQWRRSFSHDFPP